MEKDLLAATTLHGLHLKNACIRSATNENMASKDHTPSDKLVLYYEELAKHVGLIITGFCYPDPQEIVTDRMLGLYHDTQIPQYAQLCKQVHKHDTRILLQIVAGGDHKTRTPNDYTHKEIQDLPRIFAACAHRAYLAGFDGVQLHFAHGYVLSQFLTPCKNTRTDEYGGSYENRTRIHKAILQELRSCCPTSFHISIKLHCDDFIEQGFLMEECIKLSKELAVLGLNSIEVSGGNYRTIQTTGYYITEANRLANLVDIPVFAVGGNNHMKTMQAHFEQTKLQALSISRALINNSNFVDTRSSISNCVKCGSCFTLGTPCVQHLHKRTLFASDFDGTLSKDHHTIAPKDIEQIKQYALDNVFGIVSGRDPISLINCLDKIHLPYNFLVCFNGALCFDFHGKILHDEPIVDDPHDVLAFIKESAAVSFHVIGYKQVLLQYAPAVRNDSVHFDNEMYKDYTVVSSIDELDNIYMWSCEFTDDQVAKANALLINKYFPHLNAFSNTKFIDIMKKGISKSQGMDVICSYYKINKDNVAVIGDSYNDIEMIKDYHGFAMKGNKDVEQASQYIVNHVHEALTIFQNES